MEIEKLKAVEMLPKLSFTMTLKAYGLPAAEVGTPPMVPAFASSVSPGGNEPELSTQLWYGATPPPADRVCR